MKAQPWLKLWHEILSCSKLWRVTDALRAQYFLLLCVACKHNKDGVLPDDDDIAFFLRIDVTRVTSVLNDLVRAGLIDRDGKLYRVHDWGHWQHKQNASAERQKRYRDNRNALRNADATSNNGVAQLVAQPLRNSRAHESQSQSQSQSQKEKKLTSLSSSASSSPAPASGRRYPRMPTGEPLRTLSDDEESAAIAKANARKNAAAAAAAKRASET